MLPEWLSKPSIISSDLGSDKLPVSEMAGLDRSLMDKLGENGITDFFPGNSDSFCKLFLLCDKLA